MICSKPNEIVPFLQVLYDKAFKDVVTNQVFTALLFDLFDHENNGSIHRDDWISLIEYNVA